MNKRYTICYTALTFQAMLLPLQTLPNDFVLRGPLVIAGVQADYVVGLEGLGIGVTSRELSSGHWHHILPTRSVSISSQFLATEVPQHAAFCWQWAPLLVERKSPLAWQVYSLLFMAVMLSHSACCHYLEVGLCEVMISTGD